MHSLLPFASYRYDPFEASTSTIEKPPTEPLLDQITLDDEAGLYIYQTVQTTQTGEHKRMRGVVGILELTGSGAASLESSQSQTLPNSLPAEGWPEVTLLPHENTTSAYRSDRIPSKRPKNPVWLLDKTQAISQLISISEGDLVSRVTDSTGVHHRIWLLRQPALLREFQETARSLTLIVADGHHRLRAASSPGAPAGSRRLMCMITPSFEEGPTLATWARSYRPSEPRPDFETELRSRFGLTLVADTNEARTLQADRPLIRIGKNLYAPNSIFSKIVSDPELTDAELFESEIPFPFEPTRFHSDEDFFGLNSPNHTKDETFELLPRPIGIETVISRSLSRRLLPAKTTRFYPKALPGLLLGEDIN
jgi:hypothetical protein